MRALFLIAQIIIEQGINLMILTVTDKIQEKIEEWGKESTSPAPEEDCDAKDQN